MQQGGVDSIAIQRSQSTRREFEAAHGKGAPYSLPACPDHIRMNAVQLWEAGLDSQEQARPSSGDPCASGEDHQAVCAANELILSDECELVDQEGLEGVARLQRATNYPEGLRRDFATRTKGGRSDIRGGGSEEEDEIHSQVWQSLDNLEVAIGAT
jgi:hypothetical protein